MYCILISGEEGNKILHPIRIVTERAEVEDGRNGAGNLEAQFEVRTSAGFRLFVAP